MKFFITLLFASILGSTSFAAEPKYSFCDNSISSAPGEDGAIDDNKLIQYTQNLPLHISQETRQANQRFFKDVRRSCLDMGKIEVLSTGENFFVYNTNQDICDGGNTFGIVVSASSHETVANINDGQIECELN